MHFDYPGTLIGSKVLILPGRVSFGLVGILSRITFSSTLHMYFEHVQMTDDAFDVSKLALSGCICITDLFELSNGFWDWAYICVIPQLSSQLVRSCYFNERVGYSFVPEPEFEVARENPNRFCLSEFKGKSVIERLSVCMPYYPLQGLLVFGDEQWQQEEARLVESSKEWKNLNSILKKTQCQQTY